MRRDAASRDLSGRVPWLRERTLRWFRRHARTFPWRETEDPYLVLVAEMMLRRTRGSQVVPVYREFMTRFPTPRSLARARRHVVGGILRPLGLETRAEEIIGLGSELEKLFGGVVPRDRAELKQLSGVGDYVAGAVLTTAFNEPEWIVDTNVVRVFRRFFGLDLPAEARRRRVIVDIAQQYARSRSPRAASLALLDLAATVCKPRLPECGRCPLRSRCRFFLDGSRETTEAFR